MTESRRLVELTDDVALLRTAGSSYAIAFGDELNPVRHLHWGGQISLDDARVLRDRDPELRRRSGAVSQPRPADEEYPVWGGLRREPVALKVTLPDGVRGIVPTFVSAEQVGDDGLVVTWADAHQPLRVCLHYRVDEAADAISRWATIHNDGDAPVRIEQAFSASWPIPVRHDVQLTTLVGRYAAECQEQRLPVRQGVTSVGSVHGIPGHDAMPWVALDAGATLTAGEVWSVSLAWSGSWRIDVALAHDGRLHVLGGVQPVDLGHDLGPGAALDLPVMTGAYEGFAGHDGISRRWHDYARRHVVVQPERLRPVHYNSWFARYYDQGIADQRELVPLAAELGVELFVIDDGWFKGRLTDTAGLGDWTADPVKFPNGLGELADLVHAHGMQFGVWIEPEMANPDSDLLRAHPDWALEWPSREPTLVRHQRMLDFCRSDVRQWAVDAIADLVTEHRVDALKWDMNRPLTEALSAAAPEGEIWLAQVRGVWAVWDELRRRFPDLWLESCASGTGRADHGALSRAHWALGSDNTDPLERLAIQAGFARMNPAETIACWATDAPPSGLSTRAYPSLDFRFHVAMTGVLGKEFSPPGWRSPGRGSPDARTDPPRRSSRRRR